MLCAAVVIYDKIAQHAAQFGLALAAVRAERIEQGDVLAGDAGGFQFGQQDGQNALIGRGAGNVGVDDRHALPRPDQLAQWGAADRLRQRLLQGGALIWQPRRKPGAQHLRLRWDINH